MRPAQEGDSCRTYLADLDRQDAAMRAAAALETAPAAEAAPAPQPAAEPTDVVSAFWALAQHYQARGVNVERVAPDAVASMTPVP